MKADLLMARMDALTSQLIDDQLAQPPTAEELDWLKSMNEIQSFFVPFESSESSESSVLEYRRLYWEWRFGVAKDWLNEPLERELFVSEEAYLKCL